MNNFKRGINNLNECKIEYLPELLSYKEAEKKAMEYTKETGNEALFFFKMNDKNIEKKHVDKIFLGECDKIASEYPDKEFDGTFHTHTKQDYCRPSHRDIVSSIGYYNIIGCPHKRFKDTFVVVDLRLKNNEWLDKYYFGLEHECKEMWNE